MFRSKTLREALATGATITLAACGAHPLDVSVIALDVVGPITVSVGSPVDFQVTAVNNGSQRISWGRGSSSCQFALFVRGDELDRHSITFKACTDDIVDQGLDPGEARTEVIRWDGQISVSGLMAPLSPGQYRVYAMAGNDYQSPAIPVTVVGS